MILAPGPIASWQIDGETMETVRDFIFLGSKITADGDYSHEIKMLAPWKKSYDQPRQHIKKQRHYFANKDPSSQSCGFSSSHVWMWELDYKESLEPKNRCFWTVVLEKTRENSLDSKEIQPVNPKGNQSLILEGLMLKLNLQYSGHLIRRTDSFQKTLRLGKIEGGRRRKWQDEMAGWHHRLDGHEFEQAPVVADGQGGLVCCRPWGCKESDMTGRLKWTELYSQGLTMCLGHGLLRSAV